MPLPAQAGRRSLLPFLGVTFGIAVAMGSSIGVGLFRAPGAVAARLPEFWPFIAVWIGGGVYALLGANALAELATMFPRSGGPYVYIRHGLGEYAGFVAGWTDWLATCGATAVVATVVGEFALALIPELRTYEVAALMTVLALTLLQWFGIRTGAATQTILTLAKLVAIAALVVACVILGSRNPAGAIIQTERELPMIAAVVLALQVVVFAYDGWAAPAYFGGEFREASRDLPRAMFGAVAIATLIYAAVNTAFATVVPVPTLAGERFAAATVTQRLFGINGHAAMAVIAIAVLLSTASASVLKAPRILHAMSGDGLFPRPAGEVNRGGTPDVALLISSAVAGALIITGAFVDVVAKLSFFIVANHTLAFLALVALRRRDPDAERPFRAKWHPFTTIVAIVASLAFLIAAIVTDTANSTWAIAIVVVSVPVYLLLRRR